MLVTETSTFYVCILELWLRERETYLHKIFPFSVELGINHNFRTKGDSNWTKNPSFSPCFHFLDP